MTSDFTYMLDIYQPMCSGYEISPLFFALKTPCWV